VISTETPLFCAKDSGWMLSETRGKYLVFSCERCGAFFAVPSGPTMVVSLIGAAYEIGGRVTEDVSSENISSEELQKIKKLSFPVSSLKVMFFLCDNENKPIAPKELGIEAAPQFIATHIQKVFQRHSLPYKAVVTKDKEKIYLTKTR
jgi:hypothetical protein